jgi:hypothetical protein
MMTAVAAVLIQTDVGGIRIQLTKEEEDSKAPTTFQVGVLECSLKKSSSWAFVAHQCDIP